MTAQTATLSSSEKVPIVEHCMIRNGRLKNFEIWLAEAKCVDVTVERIVEQEVQYD